MKWYVACLSPSRDENAVQMLYEKGFDVFWPYLTKLLPGTKKRKARLVKRPLFPGYLFVLCDLEEVWKVEDTHGVARVICTTEGDPLPVGEDIMKELQKTCDINGEFFEKKSRGHRRRFKKHDRIKTLDEDSPFFGLIVIVKEMLGSGNICATLADATQMRVNINNPHRWELETERPNKPDP